MSDYCAFAPSCQIGLILLHLTHNFSLTADLRKKKKHRLSHVSQKVHTAVSFCNNDLTNASKHFDGVLKDVSFLLDSLQTAQPEEMIGSSKLMVCVSFLHVWCRWG